MIDETQAPGCYGSALTFDVGSAECSQCMFAAQCGPKSEARMRYLREKLQLPMPKPKAKQVINTQPQVVEMSLPKKVVELLERIERASVRVTESLAAGRNPFIKPAFMRVTCHLLLHLKDGIDTPTLTMALAKKLEWQTGTAAAHAIQARQALIALGAAVEHNGKLKLK